MAGNCLTCKKWVRIIPFPDTGFCGIIDEHPVKRLRFQYEGCEGYEGIAPRLPYRGTCQEHYDYSGWSNKDRFREELTK